MSKGKVLVVDDQRGIRCMLQELLEGEGYEVLLAESGYVAVELAEKEKPLVILMDMKMPGMDGIDTLVELKKLGMVEGVIMMTAYGELKAVQEAEALGAKGFIAKPFDIYKMSALVDEFAAKLRQAPQA